MGETLIVEQAAEEFIDEYGEEAVEVLQARAKAATELRDDVAAETWRKTAKAAEQRLRQARTKR
jgi:hypothetical protein